ncbi:hypothetical protein I7I53_02961 [Histoplasma capsulatum var. duboisii H88]|uniref:Uncharacterized protein n=1 Tax=Ajellomyces capsulatus (strain H88) TaxID=544711 RepID=A0A8A1LT47_AJEC8|nr:hypothetical protein I7I53_02961 [Histoplasma capsulatum var. duboisii H88]
MLADRHVSLPLFSAFIFFIFIIFFFSMRVGAFRRHKSSTILIHLRTSESDPLSSMADECSPDSQSNRFATSKHRVFSSGQKAPYLPAKCWVSSPSTNKIAGMQRINLRIKDFVPHQLHKKEAVKFSFFMWLSSLSVHFECNLFFNSQRRTTAKTGSEEEGTRDPEPSPCFPSDQAFNPRSSPGPGPMP